MSVIGILCIYMDQTCLIGKKKSFVKKKDERMPSVYMSITSIISPHRDFWLAQDYFGIFKNLFLGKPCNFIFTIS